MESFTVDLDKVLDEFEQNEADELAAGCEHRPSGFEEFLRASGDNIYSCNDSVVVSAAESAPMFHPHLAQAPLPDRSTKPVSSPLANQRTNCTLPTTQNNSLLRYDYPFEPAEKFDLADANFAASSWTCEVPQQDLLTGRNLQWQHGMSSEQNIDHRISGNSSLSSSLVLNSRTNGVVLNGHTYNDSVNNVTSSSAGSISDSLPQNLQCVNSASAISSQLGLLEKNSMLDNTKNMAIASSAVKLLKDIENIMGSGLPLNSVVHNNTIGDGGKEPNNIQVLPKVENATRNQSNVSKIDGGNVLTSNNCGDSCLEELITLPDISRKDFCDGDVLTIVPEPDYEPCLEIEEVVAGMEIIPKKTPNEIVERSIESDVMATSVSSETFVTPVGFDTMDVTMSEHELERHLAELEELENVKTLAPDVQDGAVMDKDEFSSGEEYFSPVTELATERKVTGLPSDDIDIERDIILADELYENDGITPELEDVMLSTDAGLNRDARSRFDSVLPNKPRKREESNPVEALSGIGVGLIRDERTKENFVNESGSEFSNDEVVDVPSDAGRKSVDSTSQSSITQTAVSAPLAESEEYGGDDDKEDDSVDGIVGKRVLHDAINRELALSKPKLLHVHSLKEQHNLEIKNQLNQGKLVDDGNGSADESTISCGDPIACSDDVLSPTAATASGLAGKRQRPTSLNLPGVGDLGQSQPEAAGVLPPPPPPPSLDFPTPAIPSTLFLDSATPVLDEPPSEVSAETTDYYNLWEGAESANTPVVSTAPPWLEEPQVGKVAPFWIPDSDAPACMQCNCKFTVLKRRHHCRACGRVLCSQCCGAKARLAYMDNKEARVCQQCLLALSKVQAGNQVATVPSPCSVAAPLSPFSLPQNRPNPNNPGEYCSMIPPLQQVQGNLQVPPPTVLVPVGVLKREGRKSSRGGGAGGEPKQVMFSDGIRPGGDLTELDESVEPRLPYRRPGRTQKKVEKISSDSNSSSLNQSPVRLPALPPHCHHFIPEAEGLLPPVITFSETNGEYTVDEIPNPDLVYAQIEDIETQHVTFAVNKNLFILVKLIKLDCCINSLCWCFTSRGMCTVGQEEIIILLECLPDERELPKDIFYHFSSVYEDSSQGNVVTNLGYTIFNQSFLGSREHGGFLYVRPTFQCLQKLLMPPPPYLVGILLQKWETPWAKVFPIRLKLRLGAEFCYYPCPLVSVRFRKPVYCEIGHTIMNVLADFRNYQYTLPIVRGMVIHLEDKQTSVRFPRNRYDEVIKALNNSNDHVLALGGNFSLEADSHLMCIQNDEGNYQSQAINIQNKPRKITGASFVVFNGALKSTSGITAKSSIVEDGLMIHIPSEKMLELRQALRDMRDITIGCGPINVEQPEEQVFIKWVEDDKRFNIGVKSPIDDLAMDGIQSIQIHGGTDYVGDRWLIRWTEVFLIHTDEGINSRRSEPVNISRLSEMLAQACCMALTAHLDSLKAANLTRIGLRATVDAENVGYEVGSQGAKLPAVYMNDLDSELVPVIHRAASQVQEGPITLELIFHILEQ